MIQLYCFRTSPTRIEGNEVEEQARQGLAAALLSRMNQILWQLRALTILRETGDGLNNVTHLCACVPAALSFSFHKAHPARQITLRPHLAVQTWHSLFSIIERYI